MDFMSSLIEWTSDFKLKVLKIKKITRRVKKTMIRCSTFY
jgi:hypothetical protein